MSHQASRTAAQLDDIDLLPRIKERTLLTPELAPVFRSRGTEVNLPRILRGVLARGGAASTPDLVETTGLTHPTVRHYMRLLGERGVAVHTKASPETVELTAQYEALCRAPVWETRRGRQAESNLRWEGTLHRDAALPLYVIPLSAIQGVQGPAHRQIGWRRDRRGQTRSTRRPLLPMTCRRRRAR